MASRRARKRWRARLAQAAEGDRAGQSLTSMPCRPRFYSPGSVDGVAMRTSHWWLIQQSIHGQWPADPSHRRELVHFLADRLKRDDVPAWEKLAAAACIRRMDEANKNGATPAMTDQTAPPTSLQSDVANADAEPFWPVEPVHRKLVTTVLTAIVAGRLPQSGPEGLPRIDGTITHRDRIAAARVLVQADALNFARERLTLESAPTNPTPFALLECDQPLTHSQRVVRIASLMAGDRDGDIDQTDAPTQ